MDRFDAETRGLIQAAANFLDTAAGEGLELDGIDAMTLVEGLHRLLADETTDNCFHEDVSLWLAGKIAHAQPEGISQARVVQAAWDEIDSLPPLDWSEEEAEAFMVAVARNTSVAGATA
jgi:hypothetical protein